MIPRKSSIDTANAVVVCLTAGGRITDWNLEAERVFGWSRDEAIGRDYDELLGAPPSSGDLDTAMAHLRGGAASWSFETRRRARDLGERVLLCTLIQSPAEGSAAAEMLLVAHDVTPRALAEEQLRTREAELNEAQRLSRLGSWTWKIDADVVTWSDEMFRIAGRDPIDGAPPYAEQAALYDPADALTRAVTRAVTAGEPFEIMAKIIRPDGERRWIVSRGTPIRDSAGRVVRLHGTLQDVTEVHEQQAMLDALNNSLERSEHRYRDLVENLLDVVFSVDMSGRIEYVSAAISKYGYTAADLVGEHFARLFHPGDLPALERAFASTLAGDNDPGEFRAVSSDGCIHWVQVSSRAVFEGDRPAGLTGVVIDVTEQRRAEDQLRAAQRLEAIGRLAGGVAHDFNNLLVAIIGYAEFALDSLRAEEPARKDIEEILKAGERAATLTRQLLAFSRRQLLKPEVISLNEVVRNLETMLRRLIGEDIEFRTMLVDEIAPVLADPGQIEQVLMNLVVNARDAMPGGGTITIETSSGEALDVSQSPGTAPAGWVVLHVGDTGMGMDEATKAQIFEPFFTTKATGEGTGLGLATVYGIVKQSGGSIAVETAPGAGTRFRIAFPRDNSGAAIANLPAERPAQESRRGSETILIVEDEEAVRHLARRFLSAAGYGVMTAANGLDALLACEDHDGPIDLLLTDVVMPQMSGPELAVRLTTVREDLRVLYMSGYTGSAVSKHGVLARGTHLLEKPFTRAELTRRVRQVLDEPI
jgi:PAS domain S-box-containing protein